MNDYESASWLGFDPFSQPEQPVPPQTQVQQASPEPAKSVAIPMGIQRETDITTVLEWDPESSATAETDADSGDLSSAGDLVDHLMTDDRVAGCLLQRSAIMRLPLDFSGGRSPMVRSLRDEGDFWRIHETGELKRFLAWKALLNVAVGRLEWVDEYGQIRKRGSHYIPRVVCWSARNLSQNTTTGVWSICTSTGAYEIVTPGRNGWLLWTGSSSRPWVDGCWRAIRAWCLLKDYARVDWARYSERHGMGLWKITAPGDLASTAEKRRKLGTEFKNLSSRAAFVAPAGWDIDLVEATANTADTFAKQIEFANLGISIALLGQNLTTEVSGGAFASTSVHKSVAAEIIATECEALSDFQYAQVLCPIASYEYGTIDAAPVPEYDSATPADRDGLATTWQKLGMTLKDFQATGVDKFVDLREMAERMALPMKADAGTVELTPPPAPVAPAVPAKTADTEDDDQDQDKKQVPSAPKAKQTTELAIRLASGDDPEVAPGMIAGQVYTDKVVASLGEAMATELKPFLDQVLDIVRDANESGDTYDRLIEAFGDSLSARQLGELINSAMVMTSLAGSASVKVDAGTQQEGE